MVSFINHLKIAAIVGVGGACGSILRYFVSIYIGGSHETFPWHTFIVNTVGCFLMGALTEYMALYWSASYELKTFLTVGFLGGFTTFSSFALDFGTLYAKGQLATAILYLIITNVFVIGSFFGGIFLIKNL